MEKEVRQRKNYSWSQPECISTQGEDESGIERERFPDTDRRKKEIESDVETRRQRIDRRRSWVHSCSHAKSVLSSYIYLILSYIHRRALTQTNWHRQLLTK